MRRVADPNKHASAPHAMAPNLVAVGHSVLAHIGSQKFGDAGARHLGMGRGDRLETCSPTCLTVASSVILGETIRA